MPTRVGRAVAVGRRRQQDDDAPAPWTPASLSNLKSWHRADVVTHSGGEVSSWTDQSGNGNHATQGLGARQPNTVSSWLNDQPALYFDGGDVLNVALSSMGTSWSVLVVGEFDATGGTQFLVNVGTAANGVGAVMSGTNRSLFLNGYAACDDGAGTADPESWLMTNDGAAPKQRFYLDGAEQSLSSSTNSSGAPTELNIGARTSAVALPGAGHVAEVVVVNALLSDAERALLMAYVNERYGL